MALDLTDEEHQLRFALEKYPLKFATGSVADTIFQDSDKFHVYMSTSINNYMVQFFRIRTIFSR